jgi:Xaa-Pro aminopeptidase
MKFQNIPKEFFSGNRKALSKLMQGNSIAFFFAHEELWRNGDQYYGFRQNSNFFYLTGILQTSTVLVLRKTENNNFLETLFVPKEDKKHEIWYGHQLTKEEACEISAIEDVRYLEDFKPSLEAWLSLSNVVYIDRMENEGFAKKINYTGQRFFNDLSPAEQQKYISISPLMAKLRLVKQEIELDLIRQAIRVTQQAFVRMLSTFGKLNTEYEVEAEISYVFNRHGMTQAYPPIIAGGLNATVLHYVDNNDSLMDGDLLLLDFGAENTNYAADCSRTIPVNGKFTQRQKEIYEAVLRVQEAMIPEYIPGNTIRKLNEKSGQLMEIELQKLGLISPEDIQSQDPENPRYKKYYMHGLAHFLGLDVHDVGNKDTPFEKGMILTCEPGIYIPEERIGIRIEDDILVDDIPVNLMQDIPKKRNEIETLIQVER